RNEEERYRSYISVRLEHLFKKKNASDYSGVAESIIQLSNTKITKSLKRITLHHVFSKKNLDEY
ncbi:hypothetical protein, partial [Escherichia coli]|uniref:hypothetical protein n=1 Tax=Escherichia coli TaxID=562 RepID=UPI001BFC452A